MSSEKKSQDISSKSLRELASINENRFCFDCNQRGTTYVNMSIGSFICTGCGGALRKYNQRVKSISMSNFSMQDINFIKRRGNKACRKIYLATCGGSDPEERNHNFDDYLRLKYQIQKWYRSPGPEIEEEAFIENEEAINRATQSPDAKTTRIGVNAAAGLIILPNHLRPSPIPNPPSASASANGFTGDAGDKQPSSANNVVQHHVFPASPNSSEPNAAFANAFPDPFAELLSTRPAQPSAPPELNSANFATFSSFSLIPPPIAPPPQASSKAASFPSWLDLQGAAPSLPSLAPTHFEPQQTASKPPQSHPPCFDKYAALAELDRQGKLEANVGGGGGGGSFKPPLSPIPPPPPPAASAAAFMSLRNQLFGSFENAPVVSGNLPVSSITHNPFAPVFTAQPTRPQQPVLSSTNPFASPATAATVPVNSGQFSSFQPCAATTQNPLNPFISAPGRTNGPLQSCCTDSNVNFNPVILNHPNPPNSIPSHHHSLAPPLQRHRRHPIS